MLHIHKIQNNPIRSNCYVVLFDTTNNCIVIDPGTEDNKELLDFLISKNLFPVMVFLTHEHFDHCAGVNHLKQLFDFELFCAQGASQRIINSKLNFSEYWDEIESFSINMHTKVVIDFEIVEIANVSFRFIESPGHSNGSMCIQFKDGIFTGDTLLNNIKVPLKLPGSNKEQHKVSIEKIKGTLLPGMKIYPGHGEPFSFCAQ